MRASISRDRSPARGSLPSAVGIMACLGGCLGVLALTAMGCGPASAPVAPVKPATVRNDHGDHDHDHGKSGDHDHDHGKQADRAHDDHADNDHDHSHPETLAAGVTFEDGTTVRLLNAADFNQLGQARVRFLRPPTTKSSVCHRTQAYQGEAYLGVYP